MVRIGVDATNASFVSVFMSSGKIVLVVALLLIILLVLLLLFRVIHWIIFGINLNNVLCDTSFDTETTTL